MIFFNPCRALAIALLTGTAALSALAASSDDAKGLWYTAEKDAVLEFKPCAGKTDSLCGKVVWEKDADKPDNSCGLQIAQLDRYSNDAWRDGWIYDPRDKKKYKGVLRVKNSELHVRAFVGVEVLGQTEQMSRAPTLPAQPRCPA